jgi:hypothetical protein
LACTGAAGAGAWASSAQAAVPAAMNIVTAKVIAVRIEVSRCHKFRLVYSFRV